MKRGKKQGGYIQGNKVDLIKRLASNQIKAVHLNKKKKIKTAYSSEKSDSLWAGILKWLKLLFHANKPFFYPPKQISEVLHEA